MRYAKHLLALASLLLCIPSLADTIVLHPSAQGYSNQGTPVPAGAGTNWDRVNDQTGNAATGAAAANDGDTSYVNMVTNAWYDSYSLATTNIPSGSTVTGLEIHAVVRNDASNNSAFRIFYRVNGTNTLATAQTFNSSTWTDRPSSWTGLALAESAWSTLEIGVTTTDANPDVYVTQVWVVVTYTPPPVGTTVGTVTAASSGCTSIAVTAPYTNDADGDNSLSYRTRTPSGSGAWSSSTNVSHSPSPYSFTIPSLTHGATYDVEVTYSDPDGVTGTNPQTVSTLTVGAICTGAGTATASQTPGATPSIAVSAPYTQDSDGDNTLRYRTATPTGSGSWTGWTNLSHSATPYAFTISSLSCGSSYDVQVEYLDADGIGSGTATQTVTNIVLTNCTTAGTPTGTVNSCAQITVSAPFANDANTNGTTTFEQGPAAGGPWTAVCSGVTGGSPRSCVDTTVVASSSYYYRVTYADADGVGGTAQQVIGPFNTPSCSVNSVTPGTPTATVDSCSQITVSSPFADDANNSSNTTVEYNTADSWPGTAFCSAQTGASPRLCAVSGLQNATQYWFRVTFADGDGVTGSNPQVLGPFTTRDCKVTAGGATATVNSCSQIAVSIPFTGDWDGDNTVTVRRGAAAGGPFGTTVCNALTGASPRSCVDNTAAESSTYYYQVDFTDPDGVSGTDPQVIGPFTTPACTVTGTTAGTASAVVSGCRQITVTAPFAGDGDGDGSVKVEYNTADAWPGTTACAAVGGPSPRTCIVTGLSESTPYYLRVTYTDPDGVAGTPVQVVGPSSTTACGADQIPPVLTMLAPARGAVVSGGDTFKVQVYDAGGLALASPVQWSLDGGALSATGVSPSASYTCGANCAVYEIAVPAQAPGAHYITIAATDRATPSVNVGQLNWPFTARAAKVGSGNILRRTHSSGLCLDCHALQTHSAQYTDTKYGNWAIDCLTCHTAHDTRNIYLVREQILTPNSGAKSPVFHKDDRAGGTNPVDSYLGPSLAVYDDGVCEVCHTKTNHYRNDASGGDHTHNQGARCVDCHKHTEGFKGAGCNGCHNGPPLQGSHAAHTVNAVPTSYADAAPNSTAGEYGFACAKCHNATHANDTHAGTAGDPYRVEVAGEATAPDTSGMTYQGAYAGANSEQGPDSRYWAWDNRACASVYCHGNFSGGTTTNAYTWGTSTAACGDCHGASPAAPPTGGEHTHHLTAGHGGSPINLACRDCHESVVDATPALTDRSLHVNGGADWDLRRTSLQIGASATYTGTEAGAKTPPSTTYGQCANLYCHSNGDPVNGPSAPYMVYRSIAWSPAPCVDCHSPPADPGCKGCHGFDATGGSPMIIGQNATRKGSTGHVKHITPYGFMCDDCHSVTMLDRTANRRNLDPAQATHTNGQKDVDFSAWPVDQSGGVWDGGSYTCTSTYCHSGGVATSAPFSATASAAVAWTTGTTTCRSCHGWDAAARPTIGVITGSTFRGSANHAGHVDNAAVIGTNYLCADCHQSVVASGNSPITDFTKHVDGLKQLAIAPRGSFTSSDTTPNCSSTYCHSSGQATPAYYGITWAGAGLDCKGCHGRYSPGAFTSQFGEPNYTSGGAGSATANSHQKHVTAAADCGDCHNDTSTTGTSILAASTQHTDGTRDVAIAAAWDTNGGSKTDNYTAGTKTCSSIKCHGAGSPQWGGTVYCTGCHGGASDSNNWNISDGTASVIDTAEWSAVGHGKAAVGLAGANTCLYCHADGVNHGVGTNPFRLNGATTDVTALPGAFDAGTNNGNAVCLNCHGTGSFGVDPDGGNAGYTKKTATTKVDSWHYGADHTALLDGGMRCWDCHDAHGDGSNIQMIGSDVMSDSGDAYGLTGTRPATAVVFTANAVGTDFAKSSPGPYNGVCNVCHTTAGHYTNASGDGHFGGSGCTQSCHLHDQAAVTDAFKPKSACNACHSAPPGASAGRHAKHYEVSTVPTSYANLASGTTATQYGYACAKCHTGTHFSDATHAGTAASPYQVQVVFDTTQAPANSGGTYSQLYPDATDPGADPVQNYSWTNDTGPSASGKCTSLYCHSNAAPLGGSDNKGSVSVYWNQAAGTVTCVSCHNTAARGDTAVLSDLSNAHGKHIKSTSGETGTYAFKCDECHAAVVVDNPADPWSLTGSDLGDRRNHVAGTHSVGFSSTSSVNNIDQSGGSYAQGPSYTCTNTYCHSLGTTAASPFGTPNNNALAWNGTATCTSCHSGDASQTTKIGTTNGSTKHANHINNLTSGGGVLGVNYACAECHNTVVTGNTALLAGGYALHVNGVKNVAMTSGSYVSPNCTNNYCHSSGQATGAPVQYYSVSWTTDALACNGCHGRHVDNAFVPVAGEPNYTNGGAAAAKANSHKAHVSAAADCADCHNDTSTTGTNIVSASTRHTDGVRDVAIAATYDTNGGTKYDNYTAGTKTCASIKCHGAGAPVWGATNITCRSCHLASGAGDQEVDNYVYGDGTMAMVDQEDWFAYGHGRRSTTDGTTYAESGNASANFDGSTGGTNGCLYCHTTGVAHGVSGNPYRLVNIGAGSTVAEKNGVCTVCHGGAGYNPGSGAIDAPDNIDAWHYGAAHSSTGDGGLYCWDCHDPHGDYNYTAAQRLAFMVEETPTQDHSGSGGWGVPTTLAPTPDFRFNRDGSGSQGVFSWGDYVSNTAVSGTYRGVCQVCHTSASVDHFRQTLYDSGHKTERCSTSCHQHDQPPSDAFKPAGGDCRSCHGASTQGSTPARRAVDADFSDGTTPNFRSHHVGNGSSMGGALTNFDCVVCHAEGYVNTTPNPDEVDANANYHMNGVIDLRNVDAKAMTDSGTGNIYSYDKDAIGAAPTPATWNSDNATWRSQMQTSMDPFCLGCHDSNGAATAHVSTWDTPNGSATNPFGDTTVTNNYDQLSRTGVVDIKSRVTAGASSLDVAGEPRYDQAPAGDSIPDPPQGIYSRHAIRGQSLSVYAGRNASWDTAYYFTPVSGALGLVKFQVTTDNGATYTNYSTQVNDRNTGTVALLNSLSTLANGDWFVVGFPQTFNSVHLLVGNTNRNDSVMTGAYWNGTGWTNFSSFADGTNAAGTRTMVQTGSLTWTVPAGWQTSTINGVGPVYWARFSVSAAFDSTVDVQEAYITTWNSTSLMACADCHTNDGANTTSGNAHGSGSEYLLKDGSGTAAEGTLAGASYNCYLCHATTAYAPGNSHTGNDQDYQDYTGSVGTARPTVGASGGNLYGIACMTCHGGGYETAGDSTPQFGTIHGTSQTMGVGPSGGSGTRKAYRFTNGNSMRFWDPGTWTGAGTCYTLDTTGDSFGGCTKHPAGTARSLTAGKNPSRPLKY